MDIYKYPTEKELSEFKIESLFLGFFEQWDSLRNAEVAKKNGFTVFSSAVENGYLDSEKIDNYQHGIHDYFKYLKYGFGRATDQISYLIRRGKLTRDQGIKLIKDYEGNFPNSYLGKPLKEILDHIEISIDHFQNICDKYTNKKIFKCDQNGNLIKDSKGKLINVLKYY